MNNIDINQIREEISILVDVASEREIPLTEVQSIFRSVKRQLSARNFEGLKNKLNSEFTLDTLDKLKKEMAKLISAHTLYDDKFISIFNVEDALSLKNKIESFISSTTTDENTYSYHNTNNINDSVTIYQFNIVREIKVRKQLNPNDLREDISDDFQEVIGVKRTPISCFDFILIDVVKNRVVLAIDLATVLGRNEINIAQNNFTNFLKKQIQIILDVKVDLFKKIASFYSLPKNSSNGVTEIYFMTPAGTAHHETLKGKGLDLRESTYHEKGTEGVRNEKENGILLNNDITPYKISNRFYRNLENNIDISLKSSYLAINTSNGSHLYHAYIYGSRNQNDLDFALDKLTS